MTELKKIEQPVSAAADTLKWALALVFIVGGLVGYYWFSEWPIYLRAAMVAAGFIIGLVIAAKTAKGNAAWQFMRSSRAEITKVVWPIRQEALQTTVIVVIFVIIGAMFFALLDLGLVKLTEWLLS